MAIKSMVLGIGQACMECGGQAVFAWIDSGSTQYRTSSGSWFYFPRHFRHVMNNSRANTLRSTIDEMMLTTKVW